MELLIKKFLSEKFSEKGADTEKGQFGLGYGNKVKSINLIKLFFQLHNR